MFEPEMFRNHAALVIGPLALLVALHPPAKNWLSVLVLVLVIPYWWTHLDDVLQPGHYTGADARVVAALRELPDGAYVISDEPGFVWWAGKVTPPMWNDTSIKRVEAGMITTESLADAASDPKVCAVVVWSNRFGDLPDLDGALTGAGFEQTATYGDDKALWLKPTCNPG
jgi:hypothetical protein